MATIDPSPGASLRPARPLRWLLVAHAGITLAAAIVLFVRPALIPSTVGIALDDRGVLLSWFLGAAELALALLSFGAARLDHPGAVRLVVAVFVVFHLSTAVMELVFVATTGPSPVLWANIAARVGITALFLGLGWRPSFADR